MEFIENIEIGNLIAAFAFGAAAIGLVFTVLQMKRSDVTQRGKFFKQLYEPFFLEDEMRYTFDIIEQHQPIFSKDFGTDDTEEKKRRQKSVERLLAQFEIVCSLYYRNLLSKKDIKYFDFNIKRIYNYPGFRSYYLAELDNWRKFHNLDQRPYSHFLCYLEENHENLFIPGAYPNLTNCST